MLCGDWQANDRQRKEQREDKVHDREFEPGEDDPDDIHDQRDRATRRLGFRYLTTERRNDAARESEAHEPERDADDGQAQQDATEDVAEKNYEATEDEKYDIAE